MKTLFIEHNYLSGNGGGIYAARTHINLFAHLSDEMTLVYPWHIGKNPNGIYVENIKTLIPVSDSRSKVRKFFDLCMGKVHRYELDETFFDKNRFDVVVFDNSVVSSRLIKKFKKAGIKIITIHHNYQIEYLKGDCSKFLLIPSLFWTFLYERTAVNLSDLNITLTRHDEALLREHYNENARFAVLGVFEYKNNTLPLVDNDSTESNNHFLITGNLQSKQTEDSLIPWIYKYWPILKEIVPDATLTIAGFSPSVKLSEIILKHGIELISSPIDMNPILKNADYYICPTDCGGGLKLRILDGLKAGLPVLTHEISARGYEKMMDAGFVVAYDSPSSFKNGIKKLISTSFHKCDVQKEYSLIYDFAVGKEHLRKILVIHKII